jgi:hypothetical protein
MSTFSNRILVLSPSIAGFATLPRRFTRFPVLNGQSSQSARTLSTTRHLRNAGQDFENYARPLKFPGPPADKTLDATNSPYQLINSSSSTPATCPNYSREPTRRDGQASGISSHSAHGARMRCMKLLTNCELRINGRWDNGTNGFSWVPRTFHYSKAPNILAKTS